MSSSKSCWLFAGDRDDHGPVASAPGGGAVKPPYEIEAAIQGRGRSPRARDRLAARQLAEARARLSKPRRRRLCPHAQAALGRPGETGALSAVSAPGWRVAGGHTGATKRDDSMMSAQATASAASPPAPQASSAAMTARYRAASNNWLRSGAAAGPSTRIRRRRGTRASVRRRGARRGRNSAPMPPMVDRVHRGAPPQCCSVTEYE